MRRRLIPRKPVKALTDLVGLNVSRSPHPDRLAATHPDLAREEMFAELCREVWPYTMTSIDRLWALYEATSYVVRTRLPGAFVECGVWRGGSSMMMALISQRLDAHPRDLYLYDTFAGMPDPTVHDAGRDQPELAQEWSRFKGRKNHPVFAYASLDDVRANLSRTKVPMERLHFVEGLVEDTIPERAPDDIALLRLDTDWYESTRHELEHLYPRLAPGGVLIIDDYGAWDGARRAVDEWRARLGAQAPMLIRVDDTARIAIKPHI